MRSPLFTRVRGRSQPVEKVDIELIATINRARKVPKAVCLVSDIGRNRAPREFFNRLELSRNFGRRGFYEVRKESIKDSSYGGYTRSNDAATLTPDRELATRGGVEAKNPVPKNERGRPRDGASQWRNRLPVRPGGRLRFFFGQGGVGRASAEGFLVGCGERGGVAVGHGGMGIVTLRGAVRGGGGILLG